MLFKILLNDKSDFEKSLKQRRLAAVGLLFVGLVGLAGYFLLVPGSELSQYAQGFYLGAASGITAGALILLARTHYLITHPEARRKAQIQETDERTLYILHTAFRAAGYITFFAAAAAIFVVLPLSMAAFQALFAVIVLYAVSFAAYYWLLSFKI